MPEMHLKHHHQKDKMPAGTKSKKRNLGTSRHWNLKELKDFDLSYHILASGVENIVESTNDRLMIVTEGFATNLDTKQVIRDGTVIELPAGSTIRYQGLIKYYLIEHK